MKMRRIVSAEGKAGVVMQVSDILDTETADVVTNIWGFDKIPELPLKSLLNLYVFRWSGR